MSRLELGRVEGRFGGRQYCEGQGSERQVLARL